MWYDDVLLTPLDYSYKGRPRDIKQTLAAIERNYGVLFQYKPETMNIDQFKTIVEQWAYENRVIGDPSMIAKKYFRIVLNGVKEKERDEEDIEEMDYDALASVEKREAVAGGISSLVKFGEVAFWVIQPFLWYWIAVKAIPFVVARAVPWILDAISNGIMKPVLNIFFQ